MYCFSSLYGVFFNYRHFYAQGLIFIKNKIFAVISTTSSNFTIKGRVGNFFINTFCYTGWNSLHILIAFNNRSHLNIKYVILKYKKNIYSWAQKFTPCRICKNVNHFNKIRRIMKIACYFLFSTVLNKLFHITVVCIKSTRQKNSRIYKNDTFQKFAPEGNTMC